MKLSTPLSIRKRAAFTLIELIVVIAIISLLAAFLFPTVKGIRDSATRRKVKSELARIETAIESYKAKYGFYPPDNPGNPVVNQLYFELFGTEQVVANEHRTLDNSARIMVNDFAAVFGPGTTVQGFVNHSQGGGDEGRTAVNFFSKAGLPPSQIGAYKVGNSDVRLLVTSIQWPANLGNVILGQPGLNPFRYNSSSPTNNSGSYDLWVDVFIGGKTNRISNWSEQPQTL